MKRSVTKAFNFTFLAGVLVFSARSTLALTTVSTGYGVPETLTKTSDGSYLVVDASAGEIFRMPSESAGFGSPTLFSPNPADTTFRGGTLLPVTFGTVSGQPLFGAFGYVSNATANAVGVVYAYNSSDRSQNPVGTLFASTAAYTANFAQGTVVQSFGSYSGDVLIADDYSGNVTALAPNGALSVVANVPFVQITTSTRDGLPFGITQAPSVFGAYSNNVLLSEGYSGDIYALTPDGVVHPFANVPLLPGETGLRQISILPAGFLPGQTSDELLVSVAGSKNGGGTLGELLVIDSTGTIVSSLDHGSLSAFDPRGTAFSDSGNLLITNAADGTVLMATASDFVPGSGSGRAPEPASLAILVLGSTLLPLRRRRCP